MSNLENKLKKIVNTFNNIDKNLAYEDIKKLSTKYHKNINVLNVLSQIAQKMGDIDTSINSLKKILLIGGAGYIGTEITRFFLRKKYHVICYDNFIYNHLFSVNEFIRNKNYS